MRYFRGRLFFLRPILCLVLLAAACATSNVLGVNYQLPPRPTESIARRVTLSFEDARPNREFLSPSARQELENFAGVYALTVSQPGAAGTLRGAYEVGPLFQEILRYRLEESGIGVAVAGTPADAEFKLVLKQFQLDYGDRKWTASIAYEAQLLKNGRLLTQQTINASADRFMLMKKTDAEKVVGEMVSDAINRMDLGTLFKQAGL